MKATATTTTNKLPRKPVKKRKQLTFLLGNDNAIQLMNVYEFGQKYEQLLSREQYLRENMKPLLSEPTSTEREKELEDTLRDMDNLEPVNNEAEMDMEITQTNDPNTQFDEDAYRKDVCNVQELIIPKPFEIIEREMEEEIKRTEPFDAEFDSVPSDIKNMIDFSRISTLEQVQSRNFAPLECLTEEGRQQTLNMLPRKELNYITPHIRDNSNPKLAMHKTVKPVVKNDVVLKVAVFHPERNQKTQEFLVLGSQLLTDLRDCMYCLNDHIINGRQTRSGYFFIEGTFYNDMRNPSNIDYSKTVLQWLRENERYQEEDLGNGKLFQSKKMEETRFYDLNIRLDEKYLYCHQGDCKHFIIFSEMRLIHESDDQNFYAYPIRVFQSRIRRKKCLICDIYPAKWVTYNDKHTADEPSFFCDACYRQFHYDETGRLLYSDYEVYRYYHE
jgi:snRNA-activating protein complex subunit 3